LWGGCWQLGAGAGAGEDMEQLFSYLSRVGITTRIMLQQVPHVIYSMSFGIYRFKYRKGRQNYRGSAVLELAKN